MTRRNVTIDPLAAARAVEAPAIGEILSLKSGRISDARRFIRLRTYEKLVRLRTEILGLIQRRRPRFVCPICATPVYLVASPIKAFFFRHSVEDGSCPAVTRGKLSEEEIRARKYAGIQESDAHKRQKGLITRSLQADTFFSNIQTESRWRSSHAPAFFRQPDVCALFGKLRIAFEAQLTTTFISVVVGRREFYRSEGALLVWILARFDPYDRRMTEDDILFPNNSNLLVVDDETASASETAGRFLLKCYFRQPSSTAADGRAIWAMRIVGFNELTIDTERQRAFLVDVEGDELKRIAVIQARQEEEARRNMEKSDALRQRFLEFAAIDRRNDPPFGYHDTVAIWQGFRRSFKSAGISLPEYLWDDSTDQLTKCLLSARDGVPRGWGYPKLISVAHQIYEQHPRFVLLFVFALRAYGHVATLKEQDRKGTWAAKAAQLRAALKNGDQRFAPDLSMKAFVAFLFPEVMPILDAYCASHHGTA